MGREVEKEVVISVRKKYYRNVECVKEFRLDCEGDNLLDIMLSIIVPVYNHEAYVIQALESIQKQNIKYSYEVLIGEDCSEDLSRELLIEYEKKELFNYTFCYRDKNWGMFDNITDLFRRAKGRYIIMLEADDYWSYTNKINEQIEFLENNTSYSGYAHSVTVIDEKNTVLESGYRSEKGKGIYTIKDYLKGKLPGQTASFMYRNYFSETNVFEYMINCKDYALDRFIAYVVASRGAVYCTAQKWSVYRYIMEGGTSYSANLDSKSKRFADNALKYHLALYKYSLGEAKKKNCIGVSEKLYYKSFLRDWRDSKNRSLCLLFKEMIKMHFPIRTLGWIFVQLLRGNKD